MSTLPPELDGLVDELADRLVTEIKGEVTEDVRDAVVEEVRVEVMDDLPSELAQELLDRELESLAPSDGIERFVDKLREDPDIEEDTIEAYRTKLDYVEEYLTDELGLDDLNDLTARQAEEYEEWRKHESLDREEPLSGPTLKDDIGLYLRFLNYMVAIKAVSGEVPNAVDRVALGDERTDNEKLDSDRAADILVYLGKFEYASDAHVVWVLFTKTGRRPCDIRALDVEDFDDDGDEVTLKFVHRPETGTPLKEDEQHEAKIELTDETAKVIRDYIDNVRPDVTDEYGREPLLAPKDGRISKSTIKQYVYKWSRPCKIGKECPYDKDPETCEAAASKDKATACPGCKSPKTIRTGYITEKRNAGSDPEAIAYRVGATEQVIKEYYDHPDEEDERKRHAGNIKSNPDSGYTNESNPDSTEDSG